MGTVGTDEAVALALPMIREFEGLRLIAGRDPAGKWEVGYGHRCAGPQSITRAEAEALLREDVAIAARAVGQAVTVPLSVGQRAALISLAYNIGATALAGSTLVKRLNAGDVPGAASEFERWVYAGGVVLPGLIRRRRAERALFEREVGGVMPLDPAPWAAGAATPEPEPDAAPEPAPERSGVGGAAVGWLLRRAAEPSTWRGVGGLLVAAGLVSAGSVEALIALGMALASVVEVIRRERGAA